MVAQEHLPLMWIIVDDASTDRTCEIVQQYADNHSFIRLVRTERQTRRANGTAEIVAFNRGFALVSDESFDCVVKLDADLSFEADYFKNLLEQFENDSTLGIASGVYLEMQSNDNWHEISMPSYHAAGASKVIRKDCFAEIGGFIDKRGWDTVDEIRAIARGWRTTHFSKFKMKHWKPEGSGMGILKTCYMHGEIYYRTQGARIFFILKVFRRLFSSPFILGGMAMLWGYFHAAIQHLEPLVTPEEAIHYRNLLTQRLKRLVGHTTPAS